MMSCPKNSAQTQRELTLSGSTRLQCIAEMPLTVKPISNGELVSMHPLACKKLWNIHLVEICSFVDDYWLLSLVNKSGARRF